MVTLGRAADRFKGPSIAGLAGLALALGSLGAQLAGWQNGALGIALVAVGVVLLVCAGAWAGARYAWPQIRQALVDRLAVALVPNTEPARLSVDARVRSLEDENQELRLRLSRQADVRDIRVAVNALLEEIEYADRRVQEDDPDYWKRAGYGVPQQAWEKYRDLLA